MFQAGWYLVTWTHLDNHCFRQTGTWMPGAPQHEIVLPVRLHKLWMLKEFSMLNFLPHSFHSHGFCGLLSHLYKWWMHVTAKYLFMCDIQFGFLWENSLIPKKDCCERLNMITLPASSFMSRVSKGTSWDVTWKKWGRRKASLLGIWILCCWSGN